MTQIARATLVAATAFALGACSGGTTADDAGNLQPAAAAGTIDSQSAPLIASAVADAVAGSQNLAGLGSYSMPSFAMSFESLGDDAPQILAATIGPEMIDCDGGGTISLSATVAVPASLTPGDILSFDFSTCDDGDGAVIGGVVEFEIVVLSGDIARGMITMTVAMNLDQLEFVDNGNSTSMHGELSFTVDTTNAPEHFVAVSSSELTLTDGAESVTVGDFIVTIASDPVVGIASLDSSATLSSTAFGGEVSYTTTESIEFAGDGGPSAGEVVVTGADGATLTIRFPGLDQAELEIDVDGNGTVDEFVITSWGELIGSS